MVPDMVGRIVVALVGSLSFYGDQGVKYKIKSVDWPSAVIYCVNKQVNSVCILCG